MARPNNIEELLARLQEEGRFAVVLWGRWDDQGNEVRGDRTGEDDFGIDATRNMSRDDVRKCIAGASTVVDPDLGVIVHRYLIERESKRLTLEDQLNDVMGYLVRLNRDAILMTWPADLPAGNGHDEPGGGLRINTSSAIEDDEAAATMLRLVAAMKPGLRPIIKRALKALG